MENKEESVIPFQDILHQLTDIILYDYVIFRQDLTHIKRDSIVSLMQYLRMIYPYQMIYDIQLLSFPYEKYYSMRQCTELIHGKWIIKDSVIDSMKEEITNYWKEHLTSYNDNFDVTIISMSNNPFENFICLKQHQILSILDLYHY